MKIVAFLPAKGASDRIHSKNMKLLDGKPLFLHTLEKLMKCDFIDEVFLDTDSEEMIEMASELGCSFLRRDPSLAKNSADGNKIFLNEVNYVEADIYIQILCTSPFIELETIRAGINMLEEHNEQKIPYDSVVMVRKEKTYLWKNGKPIYDMKNIPNSIDLEDTIFETMGLYMMRREAALLHGRRIGENPGLLYASALESVDVNYPEDFDLANLIAAGRRESERKLFNNIRNIFSSPLLSDIMDDLGMPNQVIKNLTPNINGAKFLGRAKTLKLRPLAKGEDMSGIYSALKTYETIIPNDVIVIKNDVPDYAYFGELNANLAIRSGASAVVIDGKTRDSPEVSRLGMAVFSKGYTCQDVRGRATVDHYNKAIEVEGVRVQPGDLIYGDAEGVIVIPRMLEEKIIKEARSRLSNEKSILIGISKGDSASGLVNEHGFF
ncbi:cytidylyltransferase domain-containing protein [Limnohabitans sp.]|uniref:RraA family protein n=1 Tax=Limnohabitans sp. TaxID=1907725 RepID=UPI002AFE59B3|nr:dimethylmenaquinone methyltransferase [Limnohabitans sp.]